MINQVAHVQTKTAPLPTINRALIQARHIQAHVKEQASTGGLPTRGELWSPITAGPYMVPITRWIE